MPKMEDFNIEENVLKELNNKLKSNDLQYSLKTNFVSGVGFTPNLSEELGYKSLYEIYYDEDIDGYTTNSIRVNNPLFYVEEDGSVVWNGGLLKKLVKEVEDENESFVEDAVEGNSKRVDKLVKENIEIQKTIDKAYKDIENFEDKVIDLEEVITNLTEEGQDTSKQEKELDDLLFEIEALEEVIKENEYFLEQGNQYIEEYEFVNDELTSKGIFTSSKKSTEEAVKEAQENVAISFSDFFDSDFFDKRLLRKILNLNSKTTEDFILDNLDAIISDFNNAYKEAVKARKAIKASRLDEFSVAMQYLVNDTEKSIKHIKTIEGFFETLKKGGGSRRFR